MHNLSEKDYVVAQQKDGKPFLVQVTQVEDGTFSGILEMDRRVERKFIELKTKDVMVNLGPTPKPGKVYNIDVSNLYRTSVNHDWWGSIHFYVKLDKAILKLLRNSLDRTAKVLDKAGLEAFVDKSDIEIRAPKGKWAGMYHHNPKQRSLTWYAPEKCGGAADIMDYIVYHEFGHCVRFNGVTGNKIRQKWLRLYQKSIKPVVIPSKACDAMWKKLEEQQDADDEVGFGEALHNISGEDEKYERALKVILKWLKQVQHLRPKDLDLAWKARDLEYLRDVWPTSAIDSSDLKPEVSEYATVNVEELFAECFAFHFTKKQIPSSYEDLLDKSISYAKAAVTKE